jgi:hypothetical protein
VSKYDLFRRRIAPVAFVLALGYMAFDNCGKEERTRATFVLDFGAVANEVRSVEAEIWMNGAQVTQFRRTPPEGAYIGPTRFEASLPDTQGELRIDVELGAGAHKLVTRRISFTEGATVTISLEPDLR